MARALRPDGQRSRFDRAHGVDADGDIASWTYLSDLNIDSPNWIEGGDYTPIEPERFSACLANRDIPFEDFTFIDFGSGKGRALLMASDLPFRRVMGLEFRASCTRLRSGISRCTSGRRRDRGGWSRAAWTSHISCFRRSRACCISIIPARMRCLFPCWKRFSGRSRSIPGSCGSYMWSRERKRSCSTRRSFR